MGEWRVCSPKAPSSPSPFPTSSFPPSLTPTYPTFLSWPVANTTTKLGHRTLQPTLPQLVHPFPFPTLSCT
jgi:hypothetical protein